MTTPTIDCVVTISGGVSGFICGIMIKDIDINPDAVFNFLLGEHNAQKYSTKVAFASTDSRATLQFTEYVDNVHTATTTVDNLAWNESYSIYALAVNEYNGPGELIFVGRGKRVPLAPPTIQDAQFSKTIEGVGMVVTLINTNDSDYEFMFAVFSYPLSPSEIDEFFSHANVFGTLYVKNRIQQNITFTTTTVYHTLSEHHVLNDTTVDHYGYLFARSADNQTRVIEQDLNRIREPRTDLIVRSVDVVTMNDLSFTLNIQTDDFRNVEAHCFATTIEMSEDATLSFINDPNVVIVKRLADETIEVHTVIDDTGARLRTGSDESYHVYIKLKDFSTGQVSNIVRFELTDLTLLPVFQDINIESNHDGFRIIAQLTRSHTIITPNVFDFTAIVTLDETDVSSYLSTAEFLDQNNLTIDVENLPNHIHIDLTVPHYVHVLLRNIHSENYLTITVPPLIKRIDLVVESVELVQINQQNVMINVTTQSFLDVTIYVYVTALYYDLSTFDIQSKLLNQSVIQYLPLQKSTEITVDAYYETFDATTTTPRSIADTIYHVYVLVHDDLTGQLSSVEYVPISANSSLPSPYNFHFDVSYENGMQVNVDLRTINNIPYYINMVVDTEGGVTYGDYFESNISTRQGLFTGDQSNIGAHFTHVFSESYTPVEHAFDIRAESGLYYLNNTLQPTIEFRVGDTFTFTLDGTMSQHPLWIKTERSTGNVGAITEVSNNGAGNGTLSWSPQTAGTYYYNCAIHPSMGGSIVVNDQVPVIETMNYTLYVYLANDKTTQISTHVIPYTILPRNDIEVIGVEILALDSSFVRCQRITSTNMYINTRYRWLATLDDLSMDDITPTLMSKVFEIADTFDITSYYDKTSGDMVTRSEDESSYHVYIYNQDHTTGQFSEIRKFIINATSTLPLLNVSMLNKSHAESNFTVNVSAKTVDNMDYYITLKILTTYQVIGSNIDDFFTGCSPQTFRNGGEHSLQLSQFVDESIDHFGYIRIQNFHFTEQTIYEFTFPVRSSRNDLNLSLLKIINSNIKDVRCVLLDFIDDTTIQTRFHVSNVSDTILSLPLESSVLTSEDVVVNKYHFNSVEYLRSVSDDEYYVHLQTTDTTTGQTTPIFKIRVDASILDEQSSKIPEMNNINFSLDNNEITFSANVTNSLGYDYSIKMVVCESPQDMSNIDDVFASPDFTLFGSVNQTITQTIIKFVDETSPYYGYIQIERFNEEHEVIEKIIRPPVPLRDDINIYRVVPSMIEANLVSCDFITLSDDEDIIYYISDQLYTNLPAIQQLLQ